VRAAPRAAACHVDRKGFLLLSTLRGTLSFIESLADKSVSELASSFLRGVMGCSCFLLTQLAIKGMLHFGAQRRLTAAHDVRRGPQVLFRTPRSASSGATTQHSYGTASLSSKCGHRAPGWA
jgi:hypothetical protein